MMLLKKLRTPVERLICDTLLGKIYRMWCAFAICQVQFFITWVHKLCETVFWWSARLDLLILCSWWGKIYPFVKALPLTLLQPWGVLASLAGGKAVTQGTGYHKAQISGTGTLSPNAPGTDAMDQRFLEPVSAMLFRFSSFTRYWTYKQNKTTTSTPETLFYRLSSVLSSSV